MGNRRSKRKNRQDVLQKKEEQLKAKKRPTAASGQLQTDSALLQQTLGNQAVGQMVHGGGGDAVVQKKENGIDCGKNDARTDIQQILGRNVQRQHSGSDSPDIQRNNVSYVVGGQSYTEEQYAALKAQWANGQSANGQSMQQQGVGMPQQQQQAMMPYQSGMQQQQPMVPVQQGMQQQVPFNQLPQPGMQNMAPQQQQYTMKNFAQVLSNGNGMYAEGAGIVQQGQLIHAGENTPQSRQEMLTGDLKSTLPMADGQMKSIKSILFGIGEMSLDLFNNGILGSLQGLADNLLDIVGLGSLKNSFMYVKGVLESKKQLEFLKLAQFSANRTVAQVGFYGAHKVVRRYGQGIIRAIINACNGVLRMVTIATGGAAAMFTETLSMINNIISFGMNLIQKIKGAVKAVMGTRGKARHDHAHMLIQEARRGDPDAARLLGVLTGLGIGQNDATLATAVAESLKSTVD